MLSLQYRYRFEKTRVFGVFGVLRREWYGDEKRVRRVQILRGVEIQFKAFY